MKIGRGRCIGERKSQRQKRLNKQLASNFLHLRMTKGTSSIGRHPSRRLVASLLNVPVGTMGYPFGPAACSVQHMSRARQGTQLIRAPSAGIKKRQHILHTAMSRLDTHIYSYTLYIYISIYMYISIRRDFFGCCCCCRWRCTNLFVASVLPFPLPVELQLKSRTTSRTWTTTMPSDMLLNYKTSKKTRT